MKRFALILFCLLFSAAALAQITTVYTLDGSYLIQAMKGHNVTWSLTTSCLDSSGHTHYLTGGGMESATVAVYGLLKFDGTSVVTLDATEGGVFNQVASDATVKMIWSTDGNCVGAVTDNGHAVYNLPAPLSATGTYSISADTTSGIATGVVTLSGVGVKTFVLQATGEYMECIVPATSQQIVVLSTVTLIGVGGKPKEPNQMNVTGIAVHTNAFVNPCASTTSAAAKK